MKNHYVFIVLTVLLLPVGKCFTAQAETSFRDRISLDEQMKDLKAELDEVNKEIKVAEDKKKKSGVLLPLKLKAAEIKNNIAQIGWQIRSFKESLAMAASAPVVRVKALPNSEYADVQDHLLPLDSALVRAVNAVHRNVPKEARLKKIRYAKNFAEKQLQRLSNLEDEFNTNFGVLPENASAELKVLRQKKDGLEKSIQGLVRAEERLEMSSSRVLKRGSKEALDVSDDHEKNVSLKRTSFSRVAKK